MERRGSAAAAAAAAGTDIPLDVEELIARYGRSSTATAAGKARLEMLCSATARPHIPTEARTRETFFTLSPATELLNAEPVEGFPTQAPPGLHCLNCGESIAEGAQVFPVCSKYLVAKKRFVVDAFGCRPCCALSYACFQLHNSAAVACTLNVLLQEFKVPPELAKPAPPAKMLAKYSLTGSGFSLEEYYGHGSAEAPLITTVETGRLVSYASVVKYLEETDPANAPKVPSYSWQRNFTGLRRPTVRTDPPAQPTPTTSRPQLLQAILDTLQQGQTQSNASSSSSNPPVEDSEAEHSGGEPKKRRRTCNPTATWDSLFD